jgi:transcriptional regulator with XRE-family HTH domain
MAETSLESVPGWSREQIARLKSSWITSAEQVVALSATTRGLCSLAEQLGVSEDEAQRLVDAARAELSPEDRAEMEHPADTTEYGRGARQPHR